MRNCVLPSGKAGTSDSDYVNADGEKGEMQDFLNVYHKTAPLS